MVLAGAVGAFIARRGFALPAALVAMITWFIIIYILQSIAEPVQPASFTEIALQNLSVLLLMVMAAVIGANIGIWIRGRYFKQGASAT